MSDDLGSKLQSAGEQMSSLGGSIAKMGCSGLVLLVIALVAVAVLSSHGSSSQPTVTGAQAKPASTSATIPTLEEVAHEEAEKAGGFAPTDHLENLHASGEWAAAKAPGIQPEAILFRYTAGHWSVYAAGTDIQGTGAPPVALRLFDTTLATGKPAATAAELAIQGFGATDAVWNETHTEDTNYVHEAAYNPNPALPE